jgi:hypothetical protein
VKDLSVAPLLGRLMTLPTNFRLDWKDLPGTNTSILRTFENYGRKKFYNIGSRNPIMKTTTETSLALIPI